MDKAKEQLQYEGKYAGTYRFVMTTELYNDNTGGDGGSGGTDSGSGESNPL